VGVHRPALRSFPARRSSDLAARERFRSSSEERSELGEFGELASESSHRSHGRYSEAWHSARDRAQERAREIQDRVYTMIDEQPLDRKSTRLNSSHVKISYAV